MNTQRKPHRDLLRRIARRAMLARGLEPDFSAAALAQLDKISSAASPDHEPVRDLLDLLWASIDNDDSLDLDQLTVAQPQPGGLTKILVAVANVDALVTQGSALDQHAHHNTTSVYTAAEIFPMLPEKLSTDLTSLKMDARRLSIVVEMRIAEDGSIQDSDIYPARVRNHAKLAYNSVSAWLEGTGPVPEAVATVPGLAENLRLQDKVAQKLKDARHVHGALTLETVEARPRFDRDEICDLEVEAQNRATAIIEDFMIAANGVTARFLATKGFPSIRRVVRTPKRWDRIVEIAAEHRFGLPPEPDSKALEEFLVKEKAADPVRFPDLSLLVIKLMGPGEYVAEQPGEVAPGHFGLAVQDYTHSTAPNRRYPDLITQRLLKAALRKAAAPYSYDELESLAVHCTDEEDAAKKVERQVAKSAAALLLESRIGEKFESIVTGASPKGTWVRLLSIPVEGKLVQGFEGVDVGHRIRVELVAVDVEQGYIDFKRTGAGP
ncbi:MAG: RNB domain-containing ribonuclease [Anaerolineales bacterium]|jgi:exoribonuclease-2